MTTEIQPQDVYIQISVHDSGRLSRNRRERERKARRRAENQRIVAKARAMGCFLCRTLGSHLEFHHIVPEEKRFEIGDYRARSACMLLDEIRRTLCLCRDCHQEHHFDAEGAS